MSERKAPPTPECDRLAAMKDQADPVFAFITWLTESDTKYALAVVDDEYDLDYFYGPSNKVLYEYLGIDEAKLETERRALLAYMAEL